MDETGDRAGRDAAGREAGALRIDLRYGIAYLDLVTASARGGDVAETREATPGVLVDVDADGHAVGVEVLDLADAATLERDVAAAARVDAVQHTWLAVASATLAAAHTSRAGRRLA